MPSLAGRIAVAALALLAAGTCPPPAPSGPPRQDPATAAACGACHQDIHREWLDSAHARAFTDPVYQQALRGRPRPEFCHNCHIPDQVLDRLGNKPRARAGQHADGVGCAACHRRGERIHGPFGAATDAHPSVQDPAFTERGSLGLCGSCHGTRIAGVEPLARDFETSGLLEQGKSCIGCHMPGLERHLAVDPDSGQPVGERRRGRSHALRGPGDAEFCASAFAFAARRAGDRLVVEVGNEAGHRVPGLDLRRFALRFLQVDARDATLHEHPFTVSTENPLLVRETRRLELPLQAGTVAVRIQVDHQFAGRTVARVLDVRLELRP